MEWFVRWFIRASLVWLALGITLGLCMAAHPGWIIYRPAHVHMNLVGFVTMMIFGVVAGGTLETIGDYRFVRIFWRTTGLRVAVGAPRCASAGWIGAALIAESVGPMFRTVPQAWWQSG